MIRALGWSLLHFVWQGAAAAALLGSLNLLWRRSAPQVRYLLATATLLLMLLLPALTFWLMRASADPVGPMADAGNPVGKWSPWAFSTLGSTNAPRSATAGLNRRIEPLLPTCVVLWGVGVLALSLRTVGGWALVQRLRRSRLTRPTPVSEGTLERLLGALRVSAPVRLYESALVQVPTVIGWLRPIILLPASAVIGLSPTQLELILAHELAHIRRRDYLVNLLQAAVETLLFYHPAVWWVSHRMRIEREHCCDDLAVAAGGDAARYARALADLEGLCSAPALAMAATGGSLWDRIARLVGPPQHLSRASRGLATVLTLTVLGLALGVGSSLLCGPSTLKATFAASALSDDHPSQPATSEDPSAPATAAALEEPPQGAPAPEPKPKPRPAPVPRAAPRAFPLERVLELARAGVTPEYIDAMDALGYPSLTADQLIALRSQGVGPEYIRDLAGEGYKSLSPDQLISLRAQGVSARYVRGLKEQGITGLSISNLLELRAQGVSPEYVAEMKGAGYEELSVSRLIALRSQGVSGRLAAELKALGYDKLPLSKLIALRSQGVSPTYIREMAGLGYPGLDLPVLLGLRTQGVTPEYVRELKEAGYEDLPAGMLIELRSHGVTPAFIRELKEAGFNKLRPEELIELRNSGLRGGLLKRLKSLQQPGGVQP
jgi:beta-lactamase regulating signal transducer with metallopeptidase domain